MAVLVTNWNRHREELQNIHKAELVKNSRLKFRPNVSPNSVKLATKSRRKYIALNESQKHHDYLLMKGAEKDKIVQNSQQKKVVEELNNWTFKPYRSPKSKLIAKTRDEPIVKRLTKASPRGEACKKLGFSDHLPPEEDRKSIKFKPKKLESRCKKGEEKVVQKQELEEEKSRAGKQEIQKKMELYPSESQSTSTGGNVAQEPNVTSKEVEAEDESAPLLFIDVHLDDKSIHRLVIWREDPKILAKNFWDKFGMYNIVISIDLDETMQSQLVDIINSQLSKLLDTINESDSEGE